MSFRHWWPTLRRLILRTTCVAHAPPAIKLFPALGVVTNDVDGHFRRSRRRRKSCGPFGPLTQQASGRRGIHD